MLTIRYHAGAAPPTTATTADEHRERAAEHLYAISRPADGLPWTELTDAQRARYRGFIRMAERQSDLTALAAAHEACAELLAIEDETSLYALPPAVRASFRTRALNLLKLFERVLTTGTPETDAKILELATHDAAMRDKLRIVHLRVM